MADVSAALNTLITKIDALSNRLASVEKAVTSGAGAAPAAAAPASGGSGGGDDAPSVLEYQKLIDDYITPLVAVVDKIGLPELKSQISALQKAINLQKDYLKIAATCKKPSQEVVIKLIKPINDLVTEIISIRDKNRPSKQFNNLSGISEGIPFIGWILVEPTPGPHVNEAKSSAQFYTNKILKEFRGKDQDQTDFANHWVNFLVELTKYVKQYHTTGVTWAGSEDASTKSLEGGAPAPASGGAPPPPCGGPPPPPPADFQAAPAKQGPDMSQVFGALNKGLDVTSGLRKVKPEERNKGKKISGAVPADAIKKAPAKKAAAAPKAVKPPKFALEGNKWVVEFQVGNKEIIITPNSMKETVYLYQCKQSVVQIKGKVNSIVMDGCERTDLVFENCVASFEMVNSRNLLVQCLGKVPSYTIDKCSCVNLILSKENLDAEVVASKSDQMNITLPAKSDSEDPVELPIPEQFKTVIRDGKLVTGSVEYV